MQRKPRQLVVPLWVEGCLHKKLIPPFWITGSLRNFFIFYRNFVETQEIAGIRVKTTCPCSIAVLGSASEGGWEWSWLQKLSCRVTSFLPPSPQWRTDNKSRKQFKKLFCSEDHSGYETRRWAILLALLPASVETVSPFGPFTWKMYPKMTDTMTYTRMKPL